MPTGVWLERNLDWLAMASVWKLGLCGERKRRMDLQGELAPCSQDGVGLAGMAQLGFPPLLYLH